MDGRLKVEAAEAEQLYGLKGGGPRGEQVSLPPTGCRRAPPPSLLPLPPPTHLHTHAGWGGQTRPLSRSRPHAHIPPLPQMAAEPQLSRAAGPTE